MACTPEVSLRRGWRRRNVMAALRCSSRTNGAHGAYWRRAPDAGALCGMLENMFSRKGHRDVLVPGPAQRTRVRSPVPTERTRPKASVEEQALELGGGQGAAEQEALHDVAAQQAQQLGLLLVLDAFGDHLQAERMR